MTDVSSIYHLWLRNFLFLLALTHGDILCVCLNHKLMFLKCLPWWFFEACVSVSSLERICICLWILEYYQCRTILDLKCVGGQGWLHSEYEFQSQTFVRTGLLIGILQGDIFSYFHSTRSQGWDRRVSLPSPSAWWCFFPSTSTLIWFPPCLDPTVYLSPQPPV